MQDPSQGVLRGTQERAITDCHWCQDNRFQARIIICHAFWFQSLGPVSITIDFPQVESVVDIRCFAVIGIKKLGPYNTAKHWTFPKIGKLFPRLLRRVGKSWGQRDLFS